MVHQPNRVNAVLSQIFSRSFALCFGVLAGLSAAHAADLYSAQVPVTSQSESERAGALKTALAHVVVGLSGGDNAVLAQPAISKALDDAVHYVQQFQYTRDITTDNGQPQVHLTLLAQFDRNAVDNLLGGTRVANASAQSAPDRPAAVDLKPQVYRVWISGVKSALDYASALGALSNNNLVRSVLSEQARGDGVQLQIEVNGALPRLLDSLPGSGLRVLNPSPPLEGIDALLGIQP